VHSEQGRGATFRVRLPLVPGDPSDNGVGSREVPVRGD
jgi:hypothetical protein